MVPSAKPDAAKHHFIRLWRKRRWLSERTLRFKQIHSYPFISVAYTCERIDVILCLVNYFKQCSEISTKSNILYFQNLTLGLCVLVFFFFHSLTYLRTLLLIKPFHFLVFKQEIRLEAVFAWYTGLANKTSTTLILIKLCLKVMVLKIILFRNFFTSSFHNL